MRSNSEATGAPTSGRPHVQSASSADAERLETMTRVLAAQDSELEAAFAQLRTLGDVTLQVPEECLRAIDGATAVHMARVNLNELSMMKC